MYLCRAQLSCKFSSTGSTFLGFQLELLAWLDWRSQTLTLLSVNVSVSPLFLFIVGGVHGFVYWRAGIFAQQLEHFGWFPGVRVFD